MKTVAISLARRDNQVDENQKLEFNASMYLVVCPTELEIRLIEQDRDLARRGNLKLLVAGPGMVESGVSLTRFLCRKTPAAGNRDLLGVILFGIGGAYPNSDLNILDFCLAKTEHFGDFGVAAGDEIAYFEDPIMQRRSYDLANPLSAKIRKILDVRKIPHKEGNFVTVNSCSGTMKRGTFLRNQFDAICENMEGAALAQVCTGWDLPLAELRCVSNLVEERDKSKWRISEAISRGSEIVKTILIELTNRGSR